MVHKKVIGRLGYGLITFENDRWGIPINEKKHNLKESFKSIEDLNEDLVKIWIERIQNIPNFTIMNSKSLAAAILFLYYNDNIINTETFIDENIERVLSVYSDGVITKKQIVYYKADILRYLRNITEIGGFKT